MIKQFYTANERPRVHISGARNGCTCEYCCSIRDAHDDDEMAMEYDLAMYRGKDMFDELKVGDSVEYYHIPHEWRKVVYHSDNIKWELIEERATKKFYAKVISKTEHRIEIDIRDIVIPKTGHRLEKDNTVKSTQKISAAECWAWGLRKIKIK
jgi:hypothetical protein